MRISLVSNHSAALTNKKMLQKALTVFLLVVLVSICSFAFAATIKVDGLSETQLYDLYSQVLSKIQLNKFSDAEKYKSSFNYDDMERNPDNHTGELIYFEGKVIQVLEGAITTYRISTGENSDVFLVYYSRPSDSERFLTDDKVWVYAKFMGLETYSSTVNKSVTVPYCNAALIVRPIKNKAVSGAGDKKLEKAISDIREALSKTVVKSKKYTIVTKKNYEDYARHEQLHKDELVKITGKVLQVVEGSSRNTIRLAVDSDSDRVFYLTVDPRKISLRVLEDDKVVINASYTGLYTYSSTMGGEITIPSAKVGKITVKGYTIPKSFPKDKNGNYQVTKAVFEDYSRRPNEHMDEPITFSATVKQVIEGTNSSEYRMAIDNNSDYIMYVVIPNSKRTTRILEGDKVKVAAKFSGLLTYESTIGTSITVPQCTASSITIPGKTTTSAKKDNKGRFTVTKKNYDSFAREEQKYKDQPITFTAEVVQVVDGDSYNIYRLAVDKDSNAMFYATIDNSKLDVRILEDDVIVVNATSTGLYSYNSSFGGKITIPSCKIDKYTVKGYKKISLGSPDNKGFYKITKKNFEELARNPNPYKGKQMTCKGKVLQVVERSGVNIYRVAVDSDYNCVFYVEYDLPSNASRILENDIVTLKGEFYGIYTYSTTFRSSVSVPALIASSMKK